LTHGHAWFPRIPRNFLNLGGLCEFLNLPSEPDLTIISTTAATSAGLSAVGLTFLCTAVEIRATMFGF
jgi:hypothetical protein